MGVSQAELFLNATETESTHPAKMTEILFFALFGVTDYGDAEISEFLMPWSTLLIKVTLCFLCLVDLASRESSRCT